MRPSPQFAKLNRSTLSRSRFTTMRRGFITMRAVTTRPSRTAVKRWRWNRTFLCVHSGWDLLTPERGMHEGALTALQRAREGLINVPFAIGFLGHACARAGRRAEAEDLLRQLVKPGQPFYADPYHLSLIQVGLGEPERALDSLEKAYQERSLFLTCWAKCDPRLDPLRVHPRLDNLLRLIGVGTEQSNPT